MRKWFSVTLIILRSSPLLAALGMKKSLNPGGNHEVSVGLNFVGWCWRSTPVTGDDQQIAWVITNSNCNSLSRTSVCHWAEPTHFQLFHCSVRAGRKLTKLGNKSSFTCRSLFSSSHINNVVWHYVQTTDADWHPQSGFSHHVHPDQALHMLQVWQGSVTWGISLSCQWNEPQNLSIRTVFWGFVNKLLQWQFLPPLYKLIQVF